MNRKYGIVQGRLLQSPEGMLQWFPDKSWEDEFDIGSEINFDFIELITSEVKDKSNPIWGDQGRSRLNELSKKHGIDIYSACFDFIIGNDVRDEETKDSLFKFIECSKSLGIKKIILPFFGASEINKNNSSEYISILNETLSIIDSSKMELCIESLMGAQELKSFISSFKKKGLAVVFDTGNTVAHGHDIYNEIVILGDLISHIHLKDKDLNNENVLLGTGLVDFYSIMQSLNEINYSGPFTFETHRGRDPIATAIHNRNFIEFLDSQFV
ncbi:sugar phosphate isomerase/epimerase [Gammaproteobacteria bacterium]|nr:sugar phosphate isomerase/epimerase [Gammaproteobacteria bacterium]